VTVSPRIDRSLVEQAVAEAELPPLLAAVASLTGHRSLLRARWRPDQLRLLEPDAGVDGESATAARQAAVEAILDLPAPGGGPPAWPSTADPSDDDRGVHPGGLPPAEVVGFLVGEEAAARYLPLLLEEMAVPGGSNPRGDDPRAPGFTVGPTDRPRRVLVIGAGMSGLAAAHRLRQAAMDVTVVDKNRDVGGTWFENTYPGCRVDVPNHLYGYSFAQRADWTSYFSPQPELLAYYRAVVDRFDLRPCLRLGSEVMAARFDEAGGVWQVEIRAADRGGADPPRTTVDTFDIVISAVGQLNRPSWPDIAGRERFGGPSFHTATWDHQVELAGRRVAVIGTGASAAQVVPAICSEVGELHVFQRTPNWLAPTEGYRQLVPPATTWLLGNLPGYAAWHRLWLFWRYAEGILPAARVDPDWRGGPAAVGVLNDLMRQILTGYLAEQFAGHPDLVDRVVPTYPPGAKRIVRDDGAWAGALTDPHVHLVTTAIDEITEAGVRTTDGQVHAADVIVYATGFRAADFLFPIQVTGRGGSELHRYWNDDARAHLGMTVPEFPNFFMLYGPNTNIVVNGSITYFSECQVGYVLQCIEHMVARGYRSVEVRPEVYNSYNRWIDEANASMVWGASNVHSWYRNTHGRISQNWPGTLVEYWERTRRMDPTEYDWA